MTSTPKTLTDDDVFKLLDQLLTGFGTPSKKKKAVRNYTMAVLMLDAGLRVGEVIKLNISDLWFNMSPVTSVQVRAEIAKNHESRQIPVSERLSNALKEMNESYWSMADKYVNYWAFGSLNASTHVTTRQVERIIRAAAMKSLGRPIHPHTLRHTFASKLMRITNMRTVQELLGHKHLSSTQIYTHPNEEDKKKAIADLQAKGMPTAASALESFYSPNVPNRLDTARANGDV